MPSVSASQTDAPLPRSTPVSFNPIAPRRGVSTTIAAAGLLTLLAVNIPAFLRTALDCDPILFDLYVRDAGRGAVLYRDMLENNTPGMIALHAVIRAGLGWSSEALRAVDLVVVGAAIGLLGCWFQRGRPDLRLFTIILLAALYLSTIEWCHCQRDGWMLLPVMAALYLRRAQARRLCEGRVSLSWAAAEGVLWGLAVWIKPQVLFVAASTWLVAAAWAGANRKTGWLILRDAVGVFTGGLAVGAVGVGLMILFGVWTPYIEHLSGWVREYSGADLCQPVGPWICRLSFVVRNSPWSFVYLTAVPVALLLILEPVRRCLAGPAREAGERPDRAILAAALVGWAFQAWCVQHVFDYPHVGGMLLAVALLTDLAASLSTPMLRTTGLAILALLTVAGHLGLLRDRAAVWRECLSDDSPELKDRLARFPRIRWADLERVANFLRERGAQDGDVSVVSDTAMPLWKRTGLRPPVRYYIVHNNLLAFPSRRAEIIGDLSRLPHQRFLVCDLSAVRWEPPPGNDRFHPETWPLPPDWYGPRRWADRVVFRAGRYVVLAIPAADVPVWIDDVTDL
jgi:hypothetical protein